MKYIKKYESLNKEYADIKYWKIPTKDPDLTIALKKIPKCTLTKKDFFDMMGHRALFSFDYLFVFFIEIENINGYYKRKGWDWTESSIDRLEDLRKFEEIIIVNKTYKGLIKVRKKDLDKYNLENLMNKFNI